MRSPRVSLGCRPGPSCELKRGFWNASQTGPKECNRPNPREKQKQKSRRRKSDGHPLGRELFLSVGSGATTAKNRPEREPDTPKEAGTGQGVGATPLGRERFFGQPRDVLRLEDIPVGPVRRAPCICPSVVGFRALLTIFCPHRHSTASGSPICVLQWRCSRWSKSRLAHLRSLAAQSDVDARGSLDLLAPAQAHGDEARRAQLALELAQARTADELSAAIQDGKRVAAAACRAEDKERARLRREAAAATRQRKEAEDAARRAAEVKAAKRAKHHNCVLRVEGEAEAGLG